MDRKMQQLIYALDALDCQIRSTKRLLGAVRSLTAPEPNQDPMAPSQEWKDSFGHHTSKPVEDTSPFPICMTCAKSKDCAVCSDRERCYSISCLGCTFKDLCAYKKSRQ